MNILVIGGNGFIGSHLIDHLLKKGHSVRVYDMSYERYRKPLKNVDYRISTLDNIPDLYEALLGINIIFHLAASSVPSTSNIDTVTDVSKNLIPTLNIINLSIKLGIKRIIFFSSGGAVYGTPLTTPICEDHPLKPISSYGIIKATIEYYLYLYQRIYSIKPLILRPSNPYGPRQGHYIAQGVISTFLRQIKTHENITIYGDGNSTKDYIYIDDLIDQCYRLSVSDLDGTFNLGSGIGTSINQILEIIKKITGESINIQYGGKPIYDVDHFVLDISKANDVLGTSQTVSMETGISNLWKWININA
jgi:UDP-glucose 4-epimerase